MTEANVDMAILRVRLRRALQHLKEHNSFDHRTLAELLKDTLDALEEKE